MNFKSIRGVVQQLRLCASTAGGTGLVPGPESSTCLTEWPREKERESEADLGPPWRGRREYGFKRSSTAKMNGPRCLI